MGPEATPAEIVAEAEHGEEEAGGHGIPEGIPEEIQASIESDGYTRPLAVQLDTPRPKNQGSLMVSLPLASVEGSFSLSAEPLFRVAPGSEDDAPMIEDQGTEEQETGDGGPEGDDLLAQDTQDDGPSFDAELGEQLFIASCSACHQATGLGIPAAFPPLAGHLPNLYNAEGGREYLIATLLYGLQGPIEVAGQAYNGLMPAWAQLGNDEIAAILNFTLTAWENAELVEAFVPIEADEVAAQRDADLSGAQVLELRGTLELP